MPPFTKQLLNRRANPQSVVSPRLREWFEPEARQTSDRPFAHRGLLHGGDPAALAGAGRSGASEDYNVFGEHGHSREYNASGDYDRSGDYNGSGEYGIARDHSAPGGSDATAKHDARDRGIPGPDSHEHYRNGLNATVQADQPATTRAPYAALPNQQMEPHLASKTHRIAAATTLIANPNSGSLRNDEGSTGAAADSSEPGRARVSENPGPMQTPLENAAPRTVQPSGPDALYTSPAKDINAPGSTTYVQPMAAGRLKFAFPGSARPTQQQATANDTTVIKVSIGRIEIKAITAPQPPPAKRRESPKPKLSLEDFLSSRKSSQP